MFKDRLRISLENRGLRAVDLANFLGKNKTTVHSYLTGKAFPSMEMLVKISEFLPDVNIHWLVTGHGDQSLETEKAPQPEEPSEPKTLLSPSQIAHMQSELERLRSKQLQEIDQMAAMLNAAAGGNLGKPYSVAAAYYASSCMVH